MRRMWSNGWMIHGYSVSCSPVTPSASCIDACRAARSAPAAIAARFRLDGGRRRKLLYRSASVSFKNNTQFHI
jgi:hypothetical protein